MTGPKAPKDPTAKGSSFYISRQKDIQGIPMPDGENIQFIFLDQLRLITFAKMVGNITDEDMLEHLKTAKGFLDMVAGVGVMLEADNPDQTIDFEMRMYGKTSIESGDKVCVSCKPDGMEKIIWLDDYIWSDENSVVGQMRFKFEEPGQYATADIKLYLREGFTAPDQEECTEIDTQSPEYKAILERSIVSMGNYSRVKNVIERAKHGEHVTIAFIGGSITQGAGAVPGHLMAYACQTWEKFKSAYGKNVRLIKAGVGGTPSEYGMIRFERDVLRNGTVRPDLIVIEFAVNDEGDETKGLCYESLIRKCLALSNDTAVVLLNAVFANDWNLDERLIPVGERYELPIVSVRKGVVPQFYLKPDTGRVLTKSQFFYDVFHPTNIGHTIMADCLMYMMELIDQAKPVKDIDWRTKEPVFGTTFENVQLIDKIWKNEKLHFLDSGSFTQTDTDLHVVALDDCTDMIPQLPNNWQHVSGSEPFRVKIHAKAFLIITKDTASEDAGKADVSVDGKKVLTINPREVGWTHNTPWILFSEDVSEDHTVEVRMIPGDEEKKFTILGFGIVE